MQDNAERKMDVTLEVNEEGLKNEVQEILEKVTAHEPVFFVALNPLTMEARVLSHGMERRVVTGLTKCILYTIKMFFESLSKAVSNISEKKWNKTWH